MSTVRATLALALALLRASGIAAGALPSVPALPVDAPTTVTNISACPPSDGAELELALAEMLTSARARRGDRFSLTLAEPLLTSEGTLPAGVPGIGEVVHAEPSRGGGKPGEILLAARYLEFQGEQIRLRGFKLGGSGQDRSRAAVGTAVVAGPFAYFLKGREIELPAGTRARARLAQALPPSLATPSPGSCAGASARTPSSEAPPAIQATQPTE